MIKVYFLPLKESLLYKGEGFIEEETINEYHAKLNDLQSRTSYDLSFLKMDKEEDFYFVPNPNPFGFTYNIANTSSTVTVEVAAKAENKKFYKRDRLIFKLSQLINLFKDNQ